MDQHDVLRVLCQKDCFEVEKVCHELDNRLKSGLFRAKYCYRME
jgi:hypothetical protein